MWILVFSSHFSTSTSTLCAFDEKCKETTQKKRTRVKFGVGLFLTCCHSILVTVPNRSHRIPDDSQPTDGLTKKLFMRTYDRHTIKGTHHFFDGNILCAKRASDVYMIISSRSKIMANSMRSSQYSVSIYDRIDVRSSSKRQLIVGFGFGVDTIAIARSSRCCSVLARLFSFTLYFCVLLVLRLHSNVRHTDK